jgi:hypothetical protein
MPVVFTPMNSRPSKRAIPGTDGAIAGLVIQIHLVIEIHEDMIAPDSGPAVSRFSDVIPPDLPAHPGDQVPGSPPAIAGRALRRMIITSVSLPVRQPRDRKTGHGFPSTKRLPDSGRVPRRCGNAGSSGPWSARRFNGFTNASLCRSWPTAPNTAGPSANRGTCCPMSLPGDIGAMMVHGMGVMKKTLEG